MCDLKNLFSFNSTLLSLPFTTMSPTVDTAECIGLYTSRNIFDDTVILSGYDILDSMLELNPVNVLPSTVRYTGMINPDDTFSTALDSINCLGSFLNLLLDTPPVGINLVLNISLLNRVELNMVIYPT